MSLFSLKDVRNHASRSGFDLSSKVAFTAKAGEILPIKWYFTIPGDKFKLKHQHFTRTQPVNTSAYTRIREYYDWFWVPLHILWNKAPEIIAQIQNQSQVAKDFTSGDIGGSLMPSISLDAMSGILSSLNGKKNQFGFNRADLSQKLFQYLGYGNNVKTNSVVYGTSVSAGTNYNQQYSVNLELSIFPILAYKKFCQDYFRYSQWQNSSPNLWNINYYDGKSSIDSIIPSAGNAYYNNNTMFDLEYCNWNKDMFMGILPEPQYGDVATVNLDTDAPMRPLVGFQSGSDSTFHSAWVNGTGSSPQKVIALGSGDVSNPSGEVLGTPLVAKFDDVTISGFNVLQLRRAEALQRWKEVTGINAQNYKSQIKAHFGVDVSSDLAHMSTYIGGSSSNIDISEVLNTNLSSPTDMANVAGKGVGSNGSFEKFYAKDYGVLMCLYHSVPLLDYVRTAPYHQLFVTQNTDFPIPELDRIGMESIPSVYYSNSSLSGGDTINQMGYLPRYFQWKTDVDTVLGAFTTTEKEWVAPITPAIMQSMIWGSVNDTPSTFITYNMFKVNPSVLNSIFQVNADSKWDTDQFLINAAFDIKAVRCLDYSGMPF